MGLLNIFYKKYIFKDEIKYFYDNPDLLVDLVFSNNTDQKKTLWIEPTCVEVALDAKTEYKILTHDKFFRIKFDKDDFIVFYLQHSFGFKLYKRATSKEITNPNEWELDHDTSEIN
jgi:hypothetical protein